jgi:hypothetical protein
LTDRIGTHTFEYVKDAVVTVRLRAVTRRRLERLARREGRSLSSQIERMLEAGLPASEEGSGRGPGGRRLSGALAGGGVPGLEDFREIRAALSASLERRTRR